MSDDPVYPMCPKCRRADVAVRMAVDEQEPCPHCGGELFEKLRRCCMPDCGVALPTTRDLPLCRDCGIKVALAHLGDAERLHAVQIELRRRHEAAQNDVRQGRTLNAVVYYAKLDDHRIKIGFTSNLYTRMRDMRVLPANLLATEPGGRDVEKQRHAEFRGDRLRGEEFRPSERLLAWIEQVRAEHGVPRIPIDTRTVTIRTKT